jgi:hypothetical protein
MNKKPCKECPWVVRNKHNDTIVNFSKRMDKNHNCHMINKNIWDVKDDEICQGRTQLISNFKTV